MRSGDWNKPKMTRKQVEMRYGILIAFPKQSMVKASLKKYPYRYGQVFL